MERSQEGEYELELWGVHPYGGWSPLPWLNLWVVGGYGFGEVTVRDNTVMGNQSSDVQSYSGSFGASAERALEENSVLPGITTVRVKAQTSITTMEMEDNGQMISSLTTEAYQQRVSMEVSYTSEVNQERYFIPTLEIGVRNDGGDGETGNGLEIGGEIEYKAMDLGLRVLVNGRWLAVHSGELEEWGVGGSIRFEPGAGQGQGFWFTLSPTFGQTQERTQQLWDANHLSDINVSSDRGVSLRTELGYGFVVSDGIAEPYGSMNFSNMGSTKYRIGARFAGGTTTASLEVGREETLSIPIEHSVKLEAKRSF